MSGALRKATAGRKSAEKSGAGVAGPTVTGPDASRSGVASPDAARLNIANPTFSGLDLSSLDLARNDLAGADFGGQDAADKTITAGAAGVVRYAAAGEALYIEGENAPYCYLLVSGVMKEYNTLDDGRRQVADFYNAGELFGISERETHLHTGEAVTPCVVRCFPREKFLAAVAASPQTSEYFLRTLMQRLHRARERIVMLGRMSALQRVAVFLQRLAAEQGARRDILLVMSRQDMADHLGLTIETVCRALSDLKRRGVIEMPVARTCTIIDDDAFDSIANNCAALQ